MLLRIRRAAHGNFADPPTIKLSLNCDAMAGPTCSTSHRLTRNLRTIHKYWGSGNGEFMFRRVALASLITTALVGLGYASQSDSKVNIVRHEPASDGRQMYMSYCASCHGVDGRGSGPVASSLKTPPSDLTALSKNHNGEYPSNYVISVLQSGISAPAHGTTAMPVWGSIFAQLDGGQTSLTKTLRISNLNAYLRKIQAN